MAQCIEIRVENGWNINLLDNIASEFYGRVVKKEGVIFFVHFKNNNNAKLFQEIIEPYITGKFIK